MNLKICAAGVFVLGFFAVSAQNVKVIQGDVVEGKETTIVFEGYNNKPVELFQINSETTSVGTSWIGSGSGTIINNGTNITYLASTPATVKLDKGLIQVQVTRSLVLGTRFTAKATGGTQHWTIRGPSTGKYITGYVLMAIGVPIGLAGTIYGLATDNDSLAVKSSIIGGASLIGSIYCLSTSGAKATLVSIDY